MIVPLIHQVVPDVFCRELYFASLRAVAGVAGEMGFQNGPRSFISSGRYNRAREFYNTSSFFPGRIQNLDLADLAEWLGFDEEVQVGCVSTAERDE